MCFEVLIDSYTRLNKVVTELVSVSSNLSVTFIFSLFNRWIIPSFGYVLCCPNQNGMETTELEGALQVLSFAMVRSNGIIN